MVVAVVAMLALMVMLAPGSAAPRATPSVQSLLTRATAMVRARKGFSKAVLLEADGTGRGEMKTATGVTKWRFVYNNQSTPKFKYRAAFVFYRNGRLGNFTAVKGPFLEDRNISKIPKMTLATAVAKLRAAGHKLGFLTVTLRWPLTGGTRTVRPINEPLYIFGFSSGTFVSVGTRTGHVRRIA